jgi:protein phosphatase
MGFDGSGASRAGNDGIHNEDAFLVEEGLGLYVVCDGASDSAAGEVAAQIASDAVEMSIRRSSQDVDVRLGRVARFVVEKAMKHAMRAVAEAERSDPRLTGLATTITLLLAHRELGIIGHRGDSRAYLIRRDSSYQLTFDHDLTESIAEESTHPSEFDVFALELRPGDTVVLCTDGAEEVVEDESIVRAAADLSPRLLASRIVSAAQRLDPTLDATVVVVRVRGEREPGWIELSQIPRGTTFGHTLELA